MIAWEHKSPKVLYPLALTQIPTYVRIVYVHTHKYTEAHNCTGFISQNAAEAV